jgi:hypothetical protein
MSAAAALARLRAAGGEAVVVDGRLKLRAARPLPDALVAEVRAHKPELLALLAANEIAPDPEPSTVCPACGCDLWWRVSVLSGGPGPWRCTYCDTPPRDAWQDGCCIPGDWEADPPPAEAPAQRNCPPVPDAPPRERHTPEPHAPATCARIDALAAELMTEAEANPAVRITDRTKALAYFRAHAAAAGEWR